MSIRAWARQERGFADEVSADFSLGSTGAELTLRKRLGGGSDGFGRMGLTFKMTSIVTMSMLASNACKGPASGPKDEHCGTDCQATALVRVICGRDPLAPDLLCIGTIVASGSAGSLVLTAGHCVRESTAGAKVFVQRADTKIDPAVYVAKPFVEPRFKNNDATSPYDFAILKVPGLRDLPGKLAVPAEMNDIHIGTVLRMPRIARVGSLDPSSAIRWESIAVATENALTVGARMDGASGLSNEAASRGPFDGHAGCQGISGTPLIVETAGRSWLVGIASRGADDCRGEVVFGRASVIYGSLLPDPDQRDSVVGMRESCAACEERLSSGSGPCAAPSAHCENDPGCTMFLRCLRTCGEESCESACVRRSCVSDGGDANAAIGIPSGELARLLRCMCNRGCETTCSLCRGTASR
jgi:hypothetical protein